MKNTKKIVIIAILTILIFSVLNLSSVNAASTTLTASNKTVKSGETFSVTISSSVKLTGWTIALTDNGGFTFSSASGGEVTGTTVYGTDLSGKTSLATYTFKAPTVTKDTKYTISFSGTAMCDVDTNEISNTNCKATITVKANQTTTTTDSNKNNTSTNTTTTTDKNTSTNKDTTKQKSSNAYLSTLGVTPKEYDFSGFSKKTMSYSVTVPSDVDSLKVLYKTEDSNAKVKVSGNSGFETGSDNKITIKVTAEDGKTNKTYTIKVTKLAEDEEKPGNLIEDDEGLYLTSLSIEALELSPEFAKDTYSYTVTLSDSTLNEVKVNAVANNEKANIDISGNTELVEGENTINILLTLEDSSEQTVYQIVVTKEASVATTNTPTTGDSLESSTTDIIGMFKGYVGIALLVLLLMIVAVIVLIVLLRKENKKIREENIDDSDTEEYNVYKNDANEFESNDREKDNFIESLYKQRNGTLDEEDLTEQEKETLEEINKQTEEIFKEKIPEGQSVEFSKTEIYDENPLEERKRRRKKGKHF